MVLKRWTAPLWYRPLNTPWALATCAPSPLCLSLTWLARLTLLQPALASLTAIRDSGGIGMGRATARVSACSLNNTCPCIRTDHLSPNTRRAITVAMANVNEASARTLL